MTRNTKTKRLFKMLPVDLTREEVVSFGDALTAKMLEKQALEAEEKERKERYKLKLNAVDTEIAKIARIRRIRKEEREVNCEERRVGTTVEIFRLDTGEIVSERQMDDKERQEELGVIGSIGKLGKGDK